MKKTNYVLLNRGLETMTGACKWQDTLIDVVKAELGAARQRCKELAARHDNLEALHINTQG